MDDWQVVRELIVQYSDIDANRHLNNVAVFRIFQDSRSYLMQRLREDITRRTGGTLVVAHVGVDFRGTALLGERLDSAVQLRGVGNKSFELLFVLRRADGGALVAEGKAVCCVQGPEGRAVSLDPLRDSLARLGELRLRERLARL